MKKIASLICLIFLLLGLTSCILYFANADWGVCTYCARYSVPGFIDYDLRATPTAEVLEKDQNGRILFKYDAEGYFKYGEENYLNLENNTVSVLGVVQYSDKKFVYFYEDINFIPYTNDEEKIDELKRINDWGKELNFDKMSNKSLGISAFSLLMYDTECDHDYDISFLKNRVSTELKMKKDYVGIVFIACDGKERELYHVYCKTDENTVIKYWMICNEDLEFAFEEIEDGPFDMKELSEFKRSNGWYYGCD